MTWFSGELGLELSLIIMGDNMENFFHSYEFTINFFTLMTTLFVAIATFYTAKSTFQTVSEMRKGRKQNIQPHLMIIPEKNHYELFWNLSNPSFLDISLLIEDRDSRNTIADNPHLILMNVGSGSATDIVIEFKIENNNNVKDLIKNSKFFNKIKAEIISESEPKFISHEYTNKYIVSYSDKSEVNLPLSMVNLADSFSQTIDIPYEILCNYKIRFISAIEHEDFDNLPIIILNVHYNDVDGLKTDKTFFIHTKIVMISDPMRIFNDSFNSNHERVQDGIISYIYVN